MPREEVQKKPPMPHAFVLNDRAKADITGIKQVMAFDENEVLLETDMGELMILGEKLHVTHLMLTEGKLTLEGRVDSAAYVERARKRGLFRRT